MLVSYYAKKKKFPKVAVVATKLNFLQYKYRFRINHKTLYSQTFPGPHFGSWTIRTGVRVTGMNKIIKATAYSFYGQHRNAVFNEVL